MKLKKKNKTRYRMYGLVPYNLSPIQQGIQFGHAVVEYSNKYAKDEEYKKWSKEDKTFIILNGGTTNLNPDRLGTLNQHVMRLKEIGIKKVGLFYEPDLGDQLTAAVFLVDEMVWDRELYPDPELIDSPFQEDWTEQVSDRELNRIISVRSFLSKLKLA